VLTIENSRSGNEMINALAKFGYSRDIGPGVYDVHSPVVPRSVTSSNRLADDAPRKACLYNLWQVLATPNLAVTLLNAMLCMLPPPPCADRERLLQRGIHVRKDPVIPGQQHSEGSHRPHLGQVSPHLLHRPTTVQVGNIRTRFCQRIYMHPFRLI
jgi:hypothetical protein